MIRVVKPEQPPAILRNRGRTATRALCDAFDATPQDYLDGVKTFASEFDSGLYGAKSVKNALQRAQHGKCCFCESKFVHTGYGDVEHYRPKGGYQQQADDDLGRPGYYWLAYAWSNLFFSCQICNQRHKKNLFPLRDPNRRARSHGDDPGSEEPLLIDPSSAETARIGFREEFAYPIDNDLGAEESITILGLNRPELTEIRRDRLALLLRVKAYDDLLIDEIRRFEAAGEVPPLRLRTEHEKNLAQFEARKRDNAEYAAMVRAALK